MQVSEGSEAKAPRALIVHAHPEQESFSTAQMTAASEGLSDAGYLVDVVDLYQEAFSPILDRGEFAPVIARFKPAAEQERAYREGTLAEDVTAHLDRLTNADLLILSFPLWWYSTPAILKGWLDRVLIPGAVYGAEQEFETAPLHGGRARFLITTGAESEFYGVDTPYGDLDEHLLPLRRSLEYIGLAVDRPEVTWRPSILSQDERQARLEAVRQLFRGSATTPSPGARVDWASTLPY